MKTLIKSFMLCVAAMLLVTTGVHAQLKGNLVGKATDGSGSVLPGATVVLKGTTLGAATDINGSYLLQGIPAGTCEIVVSYLGYASVTQSVNIVGNKTTVLDFTLEQSSTDIEGIVVTAIVDGQQRALNQQRASDNMMQVLSADQMGRFPDLNVADALRRISGVTSDGTEVQLRGTPSNFTNINVNGEQVMGSQEGSKRNESLDLIPSDILSSLEVQKTLLPSNDGDAIAGIINMRTGTARSLKAKGAIDLGTGYNFLREKMSANWKVGYSKRFFPDPKNQDGVFGVAINYSYFNSHSGYDRLEAQAWEPFSISSWKGSTPPTDEIYVPTDFRYRYQIRTTTRHGGTLALDWAPSVNTKFILSTIFNEKHDEGTRYRNRIRFRESNAYYLMPDGEGYGADRVRNISQVTGSDEKAYNININLDGETTIGTWKIDGGAFYSQSRRFYKSEMDGFQTPDWRAGKKVNGIKIPTGPVAVIPSFSTKYLTSGYIYEPTDGLGAPDEINRYDLYIIENYNSGTIGRNATAKLNASKNYLLGEYASTLSFGVKGKFMKNRGYEPSSSKVYDVTSDGTNTQLPNFLYTEQIGSSFLNDHLSFGPAPDIHLIRDYAGTNPANITLNEYSTNSAIDAYYYDSKENIFSAYVMNKTQFNKLMVLFGLRVESSNVEYEANIIERYFDENQPLQADDPSYFNAYSKTPTDSTVDYVIVLPNIQFKYDLSNNTIFRLAWTTGYSRPNVIDLVPSQNVSQDLQRITLGNPKLDPAYSNNLDLLFEHYMKSVGILSGGIFYKNIDKFQYLSESIMNDPDNQYDGYQVLQQKNGESASLFGAEVTFNTNLNFLPGFLKNLVFTSNYTFVHSEATVDANRGELRLPGQAKHTANFALAYSSKRLTLQASENFNGSYIMSLGSDADRDVWRDARWQLDLNGSFLIIKGLSIYAEAVNVLNSESFTYFGDKSRVYEFQFNGAYGRLGFSYKF